MAPRDPPKPEKALADSALGEAESHIGMGAPIPADELAVIPVIFGKIEKLVAPTLVGTNEVCPEEGCERWTMKTDL